MFGGDDIMKKMAKYRLYYTFVLALIIALMAINLLTLSVNAFNNQQAHFEETVVQSNDTLWTIAENITPNGQDVRYMVYIIRKVNHLDSAELYPGQRLLIPR
jgi:hypothetical protein